MVKPCVSSGIIATSTELSFIIEFHCKTSFLLRKIWLGNEDEFSAF